MLGRQRCFASTAFGLVGEFGQRYPVFGATLAAAQRQDRVEQFFGQGLMTTAAFGVLIFFF
jgi:hypothetical protein